MDSKITPIIKKIIEENPLSLATVGAQGKPYIVAVAYCKVKENKIVITDNFMRETVKNINNNSNIAIIVWDKKWNGYQFLGKAKYYNEGKWLKFVKDLKENKDMPTKGVIVVDINKIIKSK
jgi:uncharacterized protein